MFMKQIWLFGIRWLNIVQPYSNFLHEADFVFFGMALSEKSKKTKSGMGWLNNVHSYSNTVFDFQNKF